MFRFITRRVLLMVPTLAVISLVAFLIIELPPGSYLDAYIAAVGAGGGTLNRAEVEALRHRYGLDQPVHVRYVRWMWNMLTKGDFGYSFNWNRPVSQLIWERLMLTVVLSLATTLLIWLIAFPVGIYSAVSQYSIGDYMFTAISFVGLGIPNFMIAIALIWIGFKYFDVTLLGLFSERFIEAPWSLAKIADLLKHLVVPVIVLGTGGTAGLIRTMRANLLDELRKPYVTTARAKGLMERRVLFKYPVKVALNPFISTVGWMLPGLVSGSTIVSVVLSLPTTGPLLLDALQNQDMYLAGSFIMLLSTLTVIGTLVSDILLGVLDPRIRLGE